MEVSKSVNLSPCQSMGLYKHYIIKEVIKAIYRQLT
jgi:hypothetical protein